MAHELEYVVDNALLDCSEGTVPMFFHPTPRNIRVQGLKVANASDKVPIVNIPSFVICKKLSQQSGFPVPCVPVPQTWQDTYPVQINKQELLVYRSCIKCTSGQGTIEFLSSGQTPVGAADLAQLQQLQKEAEEALAQAEAEQNAVGESGLVEGMIPVWGSGRDTIHSLQTGNWGMAALNGAFLVYDVVSIGAGFFSFGTATVAMQAGKAGVRGLIKAGIKTASQELLQKVAQLSLKAMLAKQTLVNALKAAAKTRVCVIACFPAGTPIAVQEGQKNIEDVMLGDLVWSRHEQTGELSLKRVVNTQQRESDHLVHLQLGGERISTTVEHPFWLENRGWVKAGALRLGDAVLRADGASVAVTEIEHQTDFEHDRLPMVYNIEVADWHTYLVGKWLWWVHNADPCLTKPLEILLKGRTYLREIERITKLKVHPKQITELKNALRNKNYTRLSVEDTEKARKAFAKKRDAAIADWEKQTGQKWPRYDKAVLDKNGEVVRKAGDSYDAHHIIENTYGGDHEWWNVHPARFPDQHQKGIHGKNGPAKKVFPRKRR